MGQQYTNIPAVVTLLGPNYGINEDGTAPDIQQFIDTAHETMLNFQQTLRDAETPVGDMPSNTRLELIERWLACYYYTTLDPIYASKSTSGASGSFISDKDEPNRYRKGALTLDPTGCLKATLDGLVARGWWLGKPASAQTPINQRN